MEQTMKHLNPVNRKAARVEQVTAPALAEAPAGQARDVVALQQQGQPPQQPEPPHIPPGCSIVFSPGWEADRTGGTAGLCQPVERDLFDCHMGCFWPAQVPDQLNHAPDWTAKCAAAQKDWRKIDLVFPG
jgi:Quinohemoprotein amine dehydrogenase, gamma subunit